MSDVSNNGNGASAVGLNIVGVQFRRAGRIYDFTAGEADVKIGDDVVVDTERGPSLAKVAAIRFAFPDEVPSLQSKDLKAITRVATRRDMDETRKLTPETATSYTRERVERLGIKMSVLQSEVQFGGNKVIIYFSAPGRVDFRDLVKELAGGLKARVELKQVGARDEAKLVGGLGICGREFCCSSFLREFVPVSIKMAKNQNLALNPSKVSGGCGRILCCLTYENDLYTDLRKKLPPRGVRVHWAAEGVTGQVIKGDVLNQVVLFITEDGRPYTAPVHELEIVEKTAAASAPDEGDAEAEAWGEDIDLAALGELGEDQPRSASGRADSPQNARGGQQKPGRGGGGNRPQGGGEGGRGPDRGGRGPKGERGERGPRPPKPRGDGGQG